MSSSSFQSNAAFTNAVLNDAAEAALRSQRYEVSVTGRADVEDMRFVAHGVRACFVELIEWAVLSGEGLCEMLDAYSYAEADFCRELVDDLPADEVLEVAEHLVTVVELLREVGYTVSVEITAA